MAASITPAPGEGTAEHYHAHLDIIVDGEPVPVATGIGVDDQARLMSPLTHQLGDPHTDTTRTLTAYVNWPSAPPSVKML